MKESINCWLRTLAVAMVISGGATAVAQDASASEAIEIADRRQLFVDRSLIERMDGLSLKLHEPASGGVAIRLDKPWEGPVNFGHAILRVGGRFLMYYRGMTLDEDDTGVSCVATSHDGVEWTKPELGLVERAGNRDTNIIADEAGRPLSVTPWLDTRPGVPENERIKAVHSQPLSGEKHTPFRDPKGPKRLVMWASADGFRFRKMDPQPEIVSHLKNSFDGGNTMFWSEVEQAYVLYYRFWDTKRTMARTSSKDFVHWSTHRPMTYGDTPREHLYTNNTMPYFRAPHVYVALAARFMPGRRVVTDEKARAIGLKSSHGYFYFNDCSDGVLMTTRPGSTEYDRTFMEALVRPGPGPENWVSRTNYPLTGIFPHGEHGMMFWVTRHYMQETWHIEQMLLRLDGFASVHAPYSEGEMVTKILVFEGKELEINYRTSAAGGLRVEIQGADGDPLPGYTLEECPEIIGDEVARIVTWKGGSDVRRAAGKPIRLRFTLQDADLYSFRFRTDGVLSKN